MSKKTKYTAIPGIILAMLLAGCGVLATNGLDYSLGSASPPPVAAAPAPAPAPSCQQVIAGRATSIDACKTGDTIVLNGVNFNTGKATLTANAKTLLEEVAEALNSRPGIKVEIDGHTDSKGSDSKNQVLSEARASSVKKYLVAHGVSYGRLSTKGFGESMPVADNGTEEGRELNRRVEMKIVDDGGAVVSSSGFSSAAEPVPAAAPSPPVGGRTVVITDFSFSPSAIEVTNGSTVTWINKDQTSHSIRFLDGESGKFPPGGSYSKTFTKSGSYSYQCGVHPYMVGRVTVD